MDAQAKNWWKSGVVYQVYPASFQDTNDDGIGDLRGIIRRLDHIKDLGATIIWLSPMYDSPQHDMGYDIRNYKAIYPPYGDMDDMDELIKQVHARGLRIILDLVINHTSDEHEWFKESRSSKTNPKRDWYTWKPARYVDGKRTPPNNWASFFGGSAWEWEELTQEYYLHLFMKQQPDINFENDVARKALYADSMNWWLEKGVDGFRVDTCVLYSKDQAFPDAPIRDPDLFVQHPVEVVAHGPRIHEFLKEMGQIMSGYDAFTVGECGDASLEQVLKYVGAQEKELDSVFLFDVLEVGMGVPHRYDTLPKAWDLPSIAVAFRRIQRLIVGTDAWTTTFLENHDVARSVSRWGDDSTPELWLRSAKMLALIQCTLSGTQYIYQGQEIGMVNIPKSWPIEEYIDVESMAHWKLWKEKYGDDPEKMAQALVAMQHLSRDNARTPMQWEGGKNGGFTSDNVKPWMRLNDSAETINVAQQVHDPESVLSFWKKMLVLREEHTGPFVHGEFELVDKDNESVLAFTKTYGGVKVLVVGNWTDQKQHVPEYPGERRLLAGNTEDQGAELLPYEGRVYIID